MYRLVQTRNQLKQTINRLVASDISLGANDIYRSVQIYDKSLSASYDILLGANDIYRPMQTINRRGLSEIS